MSRKIVFRFDASSMTGGGHAVRCMTLANVMSSYGYDCFMATTQETFKIIPELKESRIIGLGSKPQLEIEEMHNYLPDGCDALVLDHFDRGICYEHQCRYWAKNIVVMDGQLRKHDCDILIDPNPGRMPEAYHKLVPASCKVLSGSKYAILRPAFAEYRQAALIRNKKQLPATILINFGAGDNHELVIITLDGLAATKFTGRVLLTGRYTKPSDDFTLRYRGQYVVEQTGWTKDMAALLSESDLMIGAGGSSLWEACCLGVPIALVKVAENQTYAIQVACNSGAAIYLGDKEDLVLNDISQDLTEILTDASRITAMKESASSLCDGLGANRVASVIDTMVNSNSMNINQSC